MKSALPRSIFVPRKEDPMRVVVFASGNGGNLRAAIATSESFPKLVKVQLVVTDRPDIKAIEIARQFGIAILVKDFEQKCGRWRDCTDNASRSLYRNRAVAFHDEILNEILSHEKAFGRLDLAVLSYHRWIHGNLLRYFNERMINQHAGDLAVMSPIDPTQRRYIGINPVLYALQAGEKRTRTTTFLVRAGEDSGEILCQGPWVEYQGPEQVTICAARKHEAIQKEQSDWPSLRFALLGIAQGHFTISTDSKFIDGNKAVFYKGIQLPYGGFQIS